MENCKVKQCEFCYYCGQDLISMDYVCCNEKSPEYLKGVTLTQDACDFFQGGKEK